MHKLMVLYPPQPDMESFKDYYVNKHLPLSRQIPGLRALRYSFDVQSLAGDANYSCIFEAEFDDAEALGAGMASEQGQIVAADVPNFAQVPPALIVCKVEG